MPEWATPGGRAPGRLAAPTGSRLYRGWLIRWPGEKKIAPNEISVPGFFMLLHRTAAISQSIRLRSFAR